MEKQTKTQANTDTALPSHLQRWQDTRALFGRGQPAASSQHHAHAKGAFLPDASYLSPCTSVLAAACVHTCMVLRAVTRRLDWERAVCAAVIRSADGLMSRRLRLTPLAMAGIR